MAQFVSQIVLPLVLAGIMFGLGLSLKSADFKQVLLQPKSALLGLLLQLVFLPTLALLLIALLPLSAAAAAGLFLLSLCPGGVTSNLFSSLARGNVALSVSVTAVMSLLAPFVLPLLFLAYLQYFGTGGVYFELPIALVIKQLFVVTLVPVVAGMIVRHLAPAWTLKVLPRVSRLSTQAMVGVIVAIVGTQPQVIQNLISINALAALMLSTVSMAFAYWAAWFARLDVSSQRTLTLEVGIQNAGTAMLVALTVLGQPQLAALPLLYGLLMNIPAFGFVFWSRRFA